MQEIALRTYTDKKILFSGSYDSVKKCVEDAINNNINLSYIDLHGEDLSSANLDGAKMQGGYFSGTNLTGANLSEADLQSAIFYNASLYNTCMCETHLNGADFRGAEFGGTLIQDSDISGCTFSTLSAFDLDFQAVRDMSACLFSAPDGAAYNMSHPPVVLKGILNTPVIIMDDTIKIGNRTLSKTIMPALMKMIGTYVQAVMIAQRQDVIHINHKTTV